MKANTITLMAAAFACGLCISQAANECSSYPERIDARLYFVKRTVSEEPVIGYVHAIPSVENFLMEWYRPSESALDPIPSEDWFPLLGDLFEVEARITLELVGALRLDYFSAGFPVTWPIGDTGLFYASAISAPLAILDLDFQVDLPHGIGWVDFEASPDNPQTAVNETSSSNVLSDRYVGVGDFMPRGVRPDGTPVGDFEAAQYWDRQVTIPVGPFTYNGPVEGGQHPYDDASAFLSAWSNLKYSTTTFTFPTPSVATGTIFLARLTSSSRPYQLPSAISETGERELGDAGDITGGELRYWPTIEITHRYTPKTPAAYARDLALQNGLPAGEQSDPFWRKNYADRIWDYTIRLRSTTSETSGFNLAVRDAEYFWRGVAGGYAYHLPTFTFLDEVFVDPVNTVANSVVGISTPVYNAMKELLLFLNVKSTVPISDAAVLERMLDGKAGYSLAGTPGEGLATAYAPTMRGYNMGLLFLTPEAIQSKLADIVAGGGCFPDLSFGEIFLNLDQAPAPRPRQSLSTNPQALLPLDAYIDTITEARISQRYFVREEGFVGPLDFSFTYDSGGLSLPGNDGGNTFAAPTPRSLNASFSGSVITRGSLSYGCLQDKMVSVTVSGPIHLSVGALRVEVGDEVRFLQPGVPFDLTIFEPGGVHNFVLSGLDGPGLEGGVFSIQVETSGQQAAIVAQTAYYAARERFPQEFFTDQDGDGMDDTWESDLYGDTLRASVAADDDGDGRPLIAEYLLGGDPTRADSGPSPRAFRQRADSGPDEWCFTFERRESSSGSYSVEVSSNLMEWSVAHVNIEERDIDQSGVAPGFFRAIVRIPLVGEPPPRFARVQVSDYDRPPGGGGG